VAENDVDEGNGRSHPIVRSVAALAVVALAVVLGLVVADNSPSRTWTSWHDVRTGVGGRHPASWHRQSFDDRIGLATHTGMVFSNVAHHFDYPKLPEGASTSLWDYEQLPDDAVVVEVSQTIRFDLDCRRSTSFPLSLTDGHLARDRPAYGGPPRLFIQACIEGQSGIGVHILVFPDAPAPAIDAIRRFVESIRPLESDRAG
jgi:hypothetical protein